MPAVIAVGAFLGASSATAAAVGTAAIVGTAGVAVAGYSAYAQNKAARSAAQVDTAAANYNARYDEALASQTDLDTQQNIRTTRVENAAYLSKQHASYAAAGVSADSGTALDAQLTNVGRLEQQIQQTWVNANQEREKLYSSAAVGRLEGAARARVDRSQGTLALINGGAKIAGSIFNMYQSGVFAGFGGSSNSTAGGYTAD